MWVGKCCTGRENRKNNWGKVQNCPQNIHNLKKLQWIIKKFKKKNGGYLVNNWKVINILCVDKCDKKVDNYSGYHNMVFAGFNNEKLCV